MRPFSPLFVPTLYLSQFRTCRLSSLMLSPSPDRIVVSPQNLNIKIRPVLMPPASFSLSLFLSCLSSASPPSPVTNTEQVLREKCFHKACTDPSAVGNALRCICTWERVSPSKDSFRSQSYLSMQSRTCPRVVFNWYFFNGRPTLSDSFLALSLLTPYSIRDIRLRGKSTVFGPMDPRERKGKGKDERERTTEKEREVEVH